MSKKTELSITPSDLNQLRRDYSLYLMSDRALPSICDGLKVAARRVLWTARDGKTIKSATLAGATMPLHPHSPPESVINTLAAPYGNNIPLLDGSGAFGTFCAPNAFGASRYTSVKVSDFTKDVVFTDLDLIPMRDNYDSTLKEPEHFLPLVPIVLLNPISGIAIGFATKIYPRSLADIINAQLAVLSNKPIQPLIPKFEPTDNTAEIHGSKMIFNGKFERVNTTTIKISKLPYGTTHTSYAVAAVSGPGKPKPPTLHTLLENGIIEDYIDNSKTKIDIVVKFKRSDLKKYTDDQLMNILSLTTNVSENLNLLNFDHSSLLENIPAEDIVKIFTEWRLEWYIKRYERLKSILEQDIQKLKDYINAVNNKASKVALTTQNRTKFKEWLSGIGVVYTDYIASLPTYRFTKDEKDDAQRKLDRAVKQLKEYQAIIDSPIKRKNIYKKELQSILDTYCK